MSYAAKKLATLHYLILTILVGLTLSCNKIDSLGFQGEKNPAVGFTFAGVKSMNMTPDGHYVLFWDHAVGFNDLSNVTYEIYLDKWDATPESVTAVADSSHDAAATKAEGRELQAKFAEMSDRQAPVTRGVLIGSVKGVRSYTLEEKIQANYIYAFQVRVVSPEGQRDTNSHVLIYSAAENRLDFSGVSGLEITPAGGMMLRWDPPASLPKDISASEISYEIYMDSTRDLPEALLDGRAITESKFDSPTSVGTLTEFEATEVPSVNVAPIAEQQGGRYYNIETELSPSLTYVFQVVARGPTGEPGANSRVLIYRRGTLSFNGLQRDRVKLASDSSKITLDWDAAKGASGNVTYVVYGDANFTQVLATTQDTSYVFQDVQPGHSYAFAVRAKDTNGSDSNTSFVVIRVGALTFAGLQQSGVTLASDNSKIDLSWAAATNAQGTVTYVIYQDSTFSTVLGQTTSLSYTLSSPTPGKLYTFGVRAKDDKGFDTNIQLAFISVPDLSDKTPPSFNGLKTASSVSDKKILLSWDASTSSDIALYSIYYSHNLTQAIATTTTTSFMVTGLTAATSYTFVVRAKDTSDNEEKNSVQKSAETLSYAVPEFSGVKSVERFSGVDGLTKLLVTWLPAGGTVTGYKVYMSTTAGGEDYNSPVTTIVGVNNTTATLSSLQSDARYYFVVRAYDSSSGTARFEQNTVEKSEKTLSIVAPTFAGATSATPGDGGLGFTTVKVAWGSPQADGVYDGFVVQYEAGTCAQGFSSAPNSTNVTGDTTRNYTVTGLTGQTTYRFRVRARFSVTNMADANSTCKEAYTSPPNPVFAGVASVTTASGIPGFTSLVVTWAAATSSFSYYKVDWSTSSSFATIDGTSQVSNINTLAKTLTSLPTKTTIYVRVAAYFDESGLQLSTGQSKVLSAKTEPIIPTGEGVSAVTITAADSLKVAWTAPTNSGAVFNGYKLWKYCGANAASNLLARVSGAADSTYATSQLEATFSGLASNVECCYQVRAYYNDGTNTLESDSTTTHQCKTPILLAPTFAGAVAATNSNQVSGFSQITLSWAAVDASEAGLFSYYEIDYATTPGGIDWAGTTTITDRTITSKVITGLTDNTTYYFRVRAVNSNGSPAVANGADAVVSAATTPKTPTGDSLASATSLGSTKAQLSYTPPSSNVNNGGLFNNVFLFVQAGTTTDVGTYRSSIESGGVTAGEITGSMSSGKITLSGAPAVIRIPTSEIIADQPNTYELWGLTPNVQVCVQSVAVYWVDGQPARYLTSSTPTTRCVTPSAGPPIFAGVTSLAGFGDSRDFTQITVNWGAITGDCTGVEISATTTPNSANFTTPAATATCGDSTKTLAGLTPHTDYYIQVRALNAVGGLTFAAGQGTELSRRSRPTVPTGDGMTSAVATVVAKAADTMAIAWTEATAGVWSSTYIWKGTGVTQTAAQNAVLAAATTKSDNSGPTSAPYMTKSSGTTTATDATATAGLYSCYLARAVYVSGSYYNASANETMRCDRPAYSTPSFAGVSSGSVLGTWSDGSAKVELTFASAPSGSIEEYNVYFSTTNTIGSFDFNSPIATIDYGESTIGYDSDPTDTKILISVPATSIADGYYVVRYKFYYGADTDTNTAISSYVSVPPTARGYVLIPKAYSGLAYDYYIMKYEASWAAGGTTPGGDTVTTTEADIATCNYEFNVNKVAAHSSCGTKAVSRKAQSLAGVTPISSAAWEEAYYGCRNASDATIMARMPTQEEWLRAAKWIGTSYTTMWNTYSDNASGHCLVSAAGAAVTGNAASCKSGLNVYDMAGNVREWVDTRMTRYDIAANSETRFSYGPVIGRTLKNGLDNISRRFHAIDPGATGLALALGADYGTPSYADRKQYGPGVQSWLDQSTGRAGFRCVAFLKSTMPAMADLAMPGEPTYTSSDYSGAASTWKIPENFYAKDTRWETVRINLTGSTTDSTAEGTVNFTWSPWSKTVCTPTCADSDSGITYKLYRFIEPTRASYRLTTPWALTGGTNPFSGDKPLDPIAVNSSGVRLYTSSTTDGKLVATVTGCTSGATANCAFVDSVDAGSDFSARKIYDYVLVAEDSAGNAAISQVQRYRSPYFTGDPVSNAASFRLETRFRRAGVLLVDEYYQQAQTRPEIMVHVPMDQSGLDHDFYIQKYEGSVYNNSITNDTPTGAWGWPQQSPSTSWTSYAAKCNDKFWQNPTSFPIECGDLTSAVNSTSATMQSKQGATPLSASDQGALWKACANTGVADEDGNTYYLALPSDTEWFKAADWGDLDLDGVIDQSTYSANIGVTITTLENGAADSTTVRCHSDSSPFTIYTANSANTANCRSRYGAADMIGNVEEWALGQTTTAGVPYDNGVDGLWLGQTTPVATQNISALGRYDLLRGIPKSSGAAAIADNGDIFTFPFSANPRGSARGGYYTLNSNALGRWGSRMINQALTSTIGGRCSR